MATKVYLLQWHIFICLEFNLLLNMQIFFFIYKDQCLLPLFTLALGHYAGGIGSAVAQW